QGGLGPNRKCSASQCVRYGPCENELCRSYAVEVLRYPSTARIAVPSSTPVSEEGGRPVGPVGLFSTYRPRSTGATKTPGWVRSSSRARHAGTGSFPWRSPEQRHGVPSAVSPFQFRMIRRVGFDEGAV